MFLLSGCYVNRNDLQVRSLEISGGELEIVTTNGDFFHGHIHNITVLVNDKTDGVYVDIRNSNPKWAPGPPVGFTRLIVLKMPSEAEKVLWEKKLQNVIKPRVIPVR